MKKRYAEDLPYWKTGQSSERALNEARNSITNAGGKIVGDGFMTRYGDGAYFIEFEMDGDSFRYVEKIMQSKKGDERAAKIQAAASLKHTIKAKVNEALRYGARRAFLSQLLLPDGTTPDQKSSRELMNLFSFTTALPSGDVIDGEIE